MVFARVAEVITSQTRKSNFLSLYLACDAETSGQGPAHNVAMNTK